MKVQLWIAMICLLLGYILGKSDVVYEQCKFLPQLLCIALPIIICIGITGCACYGFYVRPQKKKLIQLHEDLESEKKKLASDRLIFKEQQKVSAGRVFASARKEALEYTKEGMQSELNRELERVRNKLHEQYKDTIGKLREEIQSLKNRIKTLNREIVEARNKTTFRSNIRKTVLIRSGDKLVPGPPIKRRD